MHTSLVGLITMLEVRYLPFRDIVTIPLFLIIWIICEILSVAVSFLAIKFKLYDRKQNDHIRQKLGKVDKYLKINETDQYLELDAVKDYFMNYNKEWIVHNLHHIFTKEDFKQNHN